MQILLANAKIMRSLPLPYPLGASADVQNAEQLSLTTPMFQSVADKLAAEMALLDVDELARQLDCSKAIAVENWKRYKNFQTAETMPAILAYNGQAYKHLKANTLSDEALQFGQKHLWITCFLYGLLRPLDAIVPYRMEHCVTLETTNDKPINQFWKPPFNSSCLEGKINLTQTLIDSVKADDGVLIHLSTEEYEHLFDWKRVREEVKVIQPLFYVRKPNGDLKMQAVWAKSCRGAMVRYILQNQIMSPEELKGFYHVALPCKTGERGGGCFEFNPNIGDSENARNLHNGLLCCFWNKNYQRYAKNLAPKINIYTKL